MAITSLDILNLSHSLKDICEVNCNTPECLSQALKILMQYNLIQANLQFSRQFYPAADAQACLPAASAARASAAPIPPCPRACVLPAAPDAHASTAPVASCPQVSTAPAAPCPQVSTAPAAPCPRASAAPTTPVSPTTDRPPIRLDIGDPFLADYEE